MKTFLIIFGAFLLIAPTLILLLIILGQKKINPNDDAKE